MTKQQLKNSAQNKLEMEMAQLGQFMKSLTKEDIDKIKANEK